MTEKQEQWLKRTTDSLDFLMMIFFSKNTVPSEKEWESILNMINQICLRTRNNEEVGKALLSLVDSWEKKYKERIKTLEN